jgi:DtxR family transcriptional regulator, manganese transport regulator
MAITCCYGGGQRSVVATDDVPSRRDESEGGLPTKKRKGIGAPMEAGLAAEPDQADRFSKARSARSASMLEDYTELIADLIAANGEARTTDIARRLGVAHPTASKTIARLKREGLATARPYRGIFLTEAGLAMANKVRQRHRLVVDLLLAVGAPREAAEADAEGIEHYVSDATLRAFEAFLRGR